ncbi:GSCOCT00014137001.2-RA-CDS [Cotesia congregata]|uniref:Gustatory receptor n=1 Tax=Cotesia congregata TaxID=51543 RepID=A0A8J2MYQ5_COTCN|nr:GSCOCT00014137001.2-RA-CDS [Cotesia congregata]CAG5104156.1 gustatory receptor 12 [Cotesia congregata]
MYYNKYDSVYDKTFIIFQNIIFRIIGLSPWTLNVCKMHRKNRSMDVPDYKCEFSVVGYLYNISLIISHVCLTVYVKFIAVSGVHTDGLITKRVNLILFSIDTAFVCGMLLMYVINNKVMIKILNRLKDVDQKLVKCAAYEYQTNRSIFLINFFVSICYGFLVFYDNLSLAWLQEQTSAFLTCWILTQYTLLMEKILKRFKMINLALSKLDVKKKDTYRSGRLSVIYYNSLQQSLIHEIKNAHFELCRICQEINNFYGVIMLFLIIDCSFMSVMVLYVVTFSLHNDFEFDISDVTDAIWLLWMAYNIVLFTVFIASTEEDSQKTADIINILMDECAMDEIVEKKLSKFSHDIIQRKLKFIACGILPLNRKLLPTVSTIYSLMISFSLMITFSLEQIYFLFQITSTIVAYFIILLQFRS